MQRCLEEDTVTEIFDEPEKGKVPSTILGPSRKQWEDHSTGIPVSLSKIRPSMLSSVRGWTCSSCEWFLSGGLHLSENVKTKVDVAVMRSKWMYLFPLRILLKEV